MTEAQSAVSPQTSDTKRKRGKRQTAKSSKDWTIKGLPSETVEITRDAAKQSGMKINAWVSKALSDAASSTEVASSLPENVAVHSDQHILEELAKLRIQNEDLVQTINSMSAILVKMYANKL